MTESSDRPPSGGSRILVADDEQGTLELMGEILTHAGFDVVRARDGLEALSMARELVPDLALLDVMMPGMDGREVCRRLCADPALTHMPVILHSAADERDIDWRACGADAFLAKPFRLASLPDLVRQYLHARDGKPPRARRLTDEEVQALAVEILQAVRRPRTLDHRGDVLAPDRELSPEDEARVEAALLAALEASLGRDRSGDRAPRGGASGAEGGDDGPA
jgi:CheY-like chemotaxis protein